MHRGSKVEVALAEAEAVLVVLALAEAEADLGKARGVVKVQIVEDLAAVIDHRAMAIDHRGMTMVEVIGRRVMSNVTEQSADHPRQEMRIAVAVPMETDRLADPATD
jgi:hypothetical protein